jgi:transcriptional regulator GlxA family with amidase domain
VTADKKPLISLLVTPETTPAVLYGIYDVLTMVSNVYLDMVTGVQGDELLDVRIVAQSRQPFRCYGDILVEPHAGIDEVVNTDAVVVCDRYTRIDSALRGTYPELAQWLKQMHANNAILTSICSGSTILAETGLLDGLEVSGHWAYQNAYRTNYPRVRWRQDIVLSLDGENRRIITTGGVTSWQGLALYLIEHFCGRQHAIDTAKVHLLSGHPDGQLPFTAMTQSDIHNDAIIRDIQSWIARNYTVTNPVERMTEKSGLTTRTFARRFHAATRYFPLEYVQELRVESAKKLLETQANSVDEISGKVGYEDTASFRRLFKRKAGLTPMAYRKKFAGIMRH